MGTLQELLTERVDFAWILEISIIASGWVILRAGSSDASARNAGKQTITELVLLLAFLAAVNLLCAAIAYSFQYFFLLWALALGVVTYFYLRRFSAYQKKTMLLLWLALYTSSLSIMSMAGQCSILVGKFISQGIAEGVTRILVYLMILFVALYLRRFNFDDFSVMPKNGMQMLAFGNFCVLLLYVVECQYIWYVSTDFRISVVLLVGYVCMFAMTCSAIKSMHTMCHEQSAILELQTEKQRYLSEREMTQMMESKLEDLRCIRHDLKNQYAYMQILLSEGRYDELKQYFSKLSENLPTQLSMIDCGNRTMNTILNMEFAKLKSDRITVEHQLVVPPVLPFPDEDLCAILTNLLDNAADECRRLLQKGWGSVNVRLEIYPHQSYLYIKCSNSTDRKELNRTKGGIRTTKEDEQMHGYGTRIITKLAEKYNGCADYSLSGDQFIARVMLDMTGYDGGEQS